MPRWKEILKRIPNNAVGAEIGVWEGGNAYELLQGNDTLWLACIDQWKADDADYIQSGDGKSKLTQRAFDDAKALTRDRLSRFEKRYFIVDLPSERAVSLFNQAMFDFVFIDANHSYESVKADIRRWLPKIKQGGWIGGHDYKAYRGVRKAVDERFKVKEFGSDDTWFVKI